MVKPISLLLVVSGFYFPKGNGKALVFASGLMWGAKINDVVKVGGSDFNSGLTPGRIKR